MGSKKKKDYGLVIDGVYHKATCTCCNKEVDTDTPGVAGFKVDGKYPINWCLDCFGKNLRKLENAK